MSGADGSVMGGCDAQSQVVRGRMIIVLKWREGKKGVGEARPQAKPGSGYQVFYIFFIIPLMEFYRF